MKSGFFYILEGYLVLFMVLALLVVNVIKNWRYYKIDNIYLFSMLIAQTLIIFYVGRSNFVGFRNFIYMLPILIILSLPGFISISHDLSNFIIKKFNINSIKKKKIAVATKNVILGVMCLYTLFLSREVWWIESNLTRKWINVGKWLKIHAKPSDTLATPVIGGMSFYSGLRVYDMLGLTDSHIAHKKVRLGQGFKGHEKFDIDYIVNKEPTYIYLGCFNIKKDAKDLSRYAWLDVYVKLFKHNLSKDYSIISSSFNGTIFSFYKRRDS